MSEHIISIFFDDSVTSFKSKQFELKNFLVKTLASQINIIMFVHYNKSIDFCKPIIIFQVVCSMA
jgi:hypothetical protein